MPMERRFLQRTASGDERHHAIVLPASQWQKGVPETMNNLN